MMSIFLHYPDICGFVLCPHRAMLAYQSSHEGLRTPQKRRSDTGGCGAHHRRRRKGRRADALGCAYLGGGHALRKCPGFSNPIGKGDQASFYGLCAARGLGVEWIRLEPPPGWTPQGQSPQPFGFFFDFCPLLFNPYFIWVPQGPLPRANPDPFLTGSPPDPPPRG